MSQRFAKFAANFFIYMVKEIKYSTYSYRNIWTVTYPILISLVMEQMIGMTDTMFLGRVGEIELGASALAGVFYMAVFMLGFGFSIGAQIVIGRKNGEGDHAGTGKVFWHGLYFLTFLSVLLCLLFEFFSGPLMNVAVSSEHVREAALRYVRWRLPSLVFAFSTAMFRAFYVGTTNTSTLTLNSIVMVVSNVFFNWVLIFGKFGLPALGIAGAAIGSTMAEFVSLVFFIVYTRMRLDVARYGMDSPAPFNMGILRSILSVSLWTMIQSFVSISTWLLFFLFIEHTGERPLAISNIVRSTSGLIWMVLSAFASTCSTLVSNMIGSGHPEGVYSLVKRIMKLSYIVIVPILLLFSAFPRIILAIYTDMPDLINASVPSLWVLCASYLVSVAGQVLFQAVSGTGRTQAAFYLELLALAAYTLYCYVIVSVMKSDVAVCWTAEFVYGAAISLAAFLYLRSGRWKGLEIGV